MLRLNDILEKVQSYHPDPDLDLIKKAYVYSAKVHQGQVRKSGEPYLQHPLEVAGVLTELKLDEASIVTGLLHDTIEDTLATPEEITEIFGEEICQLVDGVTKLSQIQASELTSVEEKQAENFRKMIVAMARDIRVILVKLADRLHNMRTMESMKPEKQQRIAQETLDIYAPLANRLGIQWIKIELEDLSFKYLHPREYQEINDALEAKKKERDKYVQGVIELLVAKLKEAGLEAEVSGRLKHSYSIWKKMRKQAVTSIDELHDIIAFRMLMKTMPSCYEALGIIHGLWKPVPGRFKDYIAIPKPNMYQSLHTTVIGPHGDRIEIQIRTEEMHRIAEEGIAAHWAYKEGKKTHGKDAEKFAWLRQLMEWQQDLKDPKEFLETVKVDLFTDEVFVFTPKGDVKSLPRGATPVDFAYSVHSDVGAHTVGAKVSGKIVPLRYKLKNGDTVEVLTSPSAHPTKDWLSFVRTSRAQARIRSYIRLQQREKSMEIARDVLEREFKRFGMSFHKLYKSGELAKHLAELGYKQVDDLLSAIGYGKVPAAHLVSRVVPPERLAAAQQPTEAAGGDGALGKVTEVFKKVLPMGQGPKGGVRIQGINDIMVRYGKCCTPVPGDAIVGFITRGRGVTVHTTACPKVLTTDPARRVDVSWDVKGEFQRPVTIRVISEDRSGLLAKMSETFGKAGVNISQVNARATSPERAISTFEVGITDLEQLKDVMRSISRISGVISVERV